ncbi:MAG: 3-hydroxyacyl-CoA dehydrogenase [Desulfobacteraceae bacterium]|nr:3-hydroxyacyl-CoA dehydrogenase [Desulfobacteraceae bacterium]MBC2758119.1 3-hydroxyacyl-CoA dehydrogenase [Desulfobacteraceae bacterium]
MKIENIKRVLILGAGTMGQHIGHVCALHGFDVVIYDISESMLDNAKKMIENSKLHFVYPDLKPEAIETATGRISYSSNPETASKDVDIISESVFEDPELKGRVFAKFNSLCAPSTIFTTNTSSLLPSMFADATGRSEQFCALHFHIGSGAPIVDVMPHASTSSETMKVVTDFAKRIGQIPILMQKEYSGYVYNNMLISFLQSAVTLAANDVASIADIDRSWMGVMRTEIGPFGIIDMVGLPTAHRVIQFWAKNQNDKQAQANADFIKKYMDQGKQGRKTSEGFYKYPNPAFKSPDFINNP